MENLKLEVGKFYRTRNGQKVECILSRPDGIVTKGYNIMMLFKDGSTSLYDRSGNFWKNGEISDYDIISEWEETPEELFKRIGFEPTCLPTWGIWIAQYANKKWRYYENEPEQSITTFYTKTGCAGDIPEEYAPKNYTGDWKDSKFKVK